MRNTQSVKVHKLAASKSLQFFMVSDFSSLITIKFQNWQTFENVCTPENNGDLRAALSLSLWGRGDILLNVGGGTEISKKSEGLRKFYQIFINIFHPLPDKN